MPTRRLEQAPAASTLLHTKESIELVFPSTEDDAGARALPVPEWLADDLAALLAERAKRRGAPIAQDERLFESVKGPGRPIVMRFGSSCCDPSLIGAGLPPRMRTYDLRHAHAATTDAQRRRLRSRSRSDGFDSPQFHPPPAPPTQPTHSLNSAADQRADDRHLGSRPVSPSKRSCAVRRRDQGRPGRTSCRRAAHRMPRRTTLHRRRPRPVVRRAGRSPRRCPSRVRPVRRAQRARTTQPEPSNDPADIRLFHGSRPDRSSPPETSRRDAQAALLSPR